MHEIAWLLLLLAGLSSNLQTSQPSCPKTGERPGRYSKLGIVLCFEDLENGRRHLEVPAPDGSTLLVVDGADAKFTEKGKQVGESFTVGSIPQEIIWSPDSRAVIFTLSLGAIGPIKAGVNYVRQDSLPEVPDISKQIQKDFATRHPGNPCSNDVNIGGLTWEGGSKNAVFVAEVPPSSSCGSMLGYFEVYIVSIPEGRILARYPRKEAVKRWQKVLTPAMLQEK